MSFVLITDPQPYQDTMTKTERQEIFTCWDLHSPEMKKKFIIEYFLNCGEYSQESWLNYLIENLDVQECWSKIGHA